MLIRAEPHPHRAKDVGETLAAWEPKDHEGRLLPVPGQVMQLIANLEVEAGRGLSVRVRAGLAVAVHS